MHNGRDLSAPRRWLVALAVIAVAAAACSSPPTDETTDPSTTPPAATVLRVAAADWPACLNPVRCTSGATRNLVLRHVVPKLLDIDPEGRYVPSPVLDEVPEVDVDPATGKQRITYRIAPEARWHDGRPITSSDVRATWRAYLDTAGSRGGYERIVDVDDTDPMVAVVTLASTWADWRELFGGHAGWLLEGDRVGTGPDLDGRFDRDLTFGAGPFELSSFDDDAIVLTARADHWAVEQQAGVDQVRIERRIPGAAVPDGTDVVLPDAIDGASGTMPTRPVPDDFEVRRAPTTEVVGIFFDQRTGPLADRAVRAAIEVGLDRRTLLDLVVPTGQTRPELVPCLGWLPADPLCDAAARAAAAADPATADQRLNAAGWVRQDTGGRVRGGAPLTVTVTFDPKLPRADLLALAVRSRLEALGFEVVDLGPRSTAEWAAPGRVDTTGVGVFPVRLGTPARIDALYGCGVGANRLGWCDASFQSLLARLASTPDRRDRRDLATRVGSVAAEADVWLPLHQPTVTWWAGPDVVVSDDPPLGSGPLGALFQYRRDEG